MNPEKVMREEVKKYIDTADVKVVKMMHAMLEVDADNDWWNELNDEEKKEMNTAIEESENKDNLVPYETFQSEFNTWRKELLSSKEQTKK